MNNMGLKYTKLYTKLHNPERNFSTVDENLAKEILYSKNRKKDVLKISRNDGVIVVWFRYEFLQEEFMVNMENHEKEPWFMVDEKKFSFSDEYENYNICVAEFKSELLLNKEESDYIDRMCNAYYGIKEDTGRYSIYDVYSEKELLS